MQKISRLFVNIVKNLTDWQSKNNFYLINELVKLNYLIHKTGINVFLGILINWAKKKRTVSLLIYDSIY